MKNKKVRTAVIIAALAVLIFSTTKLLVDKIEDWREIRVEERARALYHSEEAATREELVSTESGEPAETQETAAATEEESRESSGDTESTESASAAETSLAEPETEEPTTCDPTEIQSDFAELLAVNDDLVGWLKAGAEIDFPVVQSDNEYYLTYDFEKHPNSNGAVFLNSGCTLYPRDQILMLHGHNTSRGRMFGTLKEFMDPRYLRDYPIVSFRTIYDAQDVFYTPVLIFNASMLPGENGYFDIKHFNFETKEELAEYLAEMQALSEWKPLVDVTADDRLLMLVTCSYYHTDGRMMMVCRALREGETPESIRELYEFS